MDISFYTGNTTMKKICGWCNKVLETNEKYASEGDITHGICSLCAIKVTSYAPRNAKQILDLVQEPVFLIDADGVVNATNRSGLELLGKDFADIENELGGDVFECSYAPEGGCGNTLHCRTCAIRNIVMDTLSTGQSYKNVPAFQNILIKDEKKILKFLISTERVKERILLRIDSVQDIQKA